MVVFNGYHYWLKQKLRIYNMSHQLVEIAAGMRQEDEIKITAYFKGLLKFYMKNIFKESISALTCQIL